MMIKFNETPSLERIGTMIENSNGNIFLEQSEECFVDMKKSRTVINDLVNALSNDKNRKLHVYDADDLTQFANYIAGMGLQ